MKRPAIITTALAGLLLLGGSTHAQAQQRDVRPAVALIECNDGKARTFQIGAVVGSNQYQSFVLSADINLPVNYVAQTHCTAPIVHFAAQPATGYAAQAVPADLSTTQFPFYLLVVDHPVTSIMPVAPQDPVPGQPVTLAGYAPDPSLATAAGAHLTMFDESYFAQPGFNNRPNVAADRYLAGAVLTDSKSGALFGFASPDGPLFRVDHPTSYGYALEGAANIAALFKQLPAPEPPGLVQLTGRDLATARARAAARQFAFFLFGSATNGQLYSPEGFMTLLGSNAASSFLVAPMPVGVTSLLVAMPQADGTTRLVAPTLVAQDAGSNVGFFTVPRLALPAPTFAEAPSSSTEFVAFENFGFLCTLQPPAA
ncbi:MAG TPA: hypothetical protein VN936_01420, partial [Candidatus Acidoferrum sp.]|nr:hypothetical protein [Candidatus Acidoferrum sp.]